MGTYHHRPIRANSFASPSPSLVSEPSCQVNHSLDLLFQLFFILGIPYFAYMVGALAELISYQIDDAVKKLQSVSRYKISPGNISSLYVLLGCLLLIVIPAMIFTKVEGNRTNRRTFPTK